MHDELAQREIDGIVVRLLWDALNNSVIVKYRDSRTGDAFDVQVPRNRALDAFNHPNAYRLAAA